MTEPNPRATSGAPMYTGVPSATLSSLVASTGSQASRALTRTQLVAEVVVGGWNPGVTGRCRERAALEEDACGAGMSAGRGASACGAPVGRKAPDTNQSVSDVPDRASVTFRTRVSCWAAVVNRSRASRSARRKDSRLTALDNGDNTAAGRLSQRLTVAAAMVHVEYPRWAASTMIGARRARVAWTAAVSTAGP